MAQASKAKREGRAQNDWKQCEKVLKNAPRSFFVHPRCLVEVTRELT